MNTRDRFEYARRATVAASEPLRRLAVRVLIAAAAFVCGGGVESAQAGPYPVRPVTLVVPFAAGSAGDGVGRLLAQGLTRKLGQSFVVENITGAGGTVGADKVYRAKPDGYYLLVGSSASITVAPFIHPNLPYDPTRFTPISAMSESPIVVIVPAHSKFHSLGDLVAAAKSEPDKITFASGGVGSASHIAGEIFEKQTGARLRHVPYRGVGASVADLVSGRVDVEFGGYPAVQALVETGKLRLIAVATDKRSKLISMDVPTSAESGVPGYVQSYWNGLFGPPGLSEKVVATLNAAINEVLSDPETLKVMARMGMDPISGTPANFAKRIANETEQMRALEKIAAIPPN